jgi:hypothetical protein
LRLCQRSIPFQLQIYASAFFHYVQILLSFALATDQVLHVHMSDLAERLTYENLVKEQLDIDQEKAELRKTYYLGKEPTPSRGYDDRLTVRTGLFPLDTHSGTVRRSGKYGHNRALPFLSHGHSSQTDQTAHL